MIFVPCVTKAVIKLLLFMFFKPNNIELYWDKLKWIKSQLAYHFDERPLLQGSGLGPMNFVNIIISKLRQSTLTTEWMMAVHKVWHDFLINFYPPPHKLSQISDPSLKYMSHCRTKKFTISMGL